jgi:hypothetical protein
MVCAVRCQYLKTPARLDRDSPEFLRIPKTDDTRGRALLELTRLRVQNSRYDRNNGLRAVVPKRIRLLLRAGSREGAPGIARGARTVRT